MNILIACEFSGIVRSEFEKKKHNVTSCDLLPTLIPGKHVEGDVRDLLNIQWDIIIAFPPCQRLTVAANRWYKPMYKSRFPNIENDRKEAIAFFLIFTKLKCNQIAIENPIGIMSSLYRKPDQIIQPYYFGDTERKSTCLWLKNLPKLTPTNIVEPKIIFHKSGRTDGKLHFETLKLKKDERAKARSLTFAGIAKAMANQWG